MSKTNWFADVRATARIDIPEIDGWIEVREELSIGDERKVFTSAIKGQTPTSDGQTRTDYDAEQVSFGLVIAHIVDWSARDKDDKPVSLTPDAIKRLKPSVYHAIEKAVTDHMEQVRASKKIQAPSGVAEATSPSAGS
jgi:hypothetical protein